MQFHSILSTTLLRPSSHHPVLFQHRRVAHCRHCRQLVNLSQQVFFSRKSGLTIPQWSTHWHFNSLHSSVTSINDRNASRSTAPFPAPHSKSPLQSSILSRNSTAYSTAFHSTALSSAPHSSSTRGSVPSKSITARSTTPQSAQSSARQFSSTHSNAPASSPHSLNTFTI
jgi:hypothetical protein